jgi:hypothetical protein
MQLALSLRHASQILIACESSLQDSIGFVVYVNRGPGSALEHVRDTSVDRHIERLVQLLVHVLFQGHEIKSRIEEHLEEEEEEEDSVPEVNIKLIPVLVVGVHGIPRNAMIEIEVSACTAAIRATPRIVYEYSGRIHWNDNSCSSQSIESIRHMHMRRVSELAIPLLHLGDPSIPSLPSILPTSQSKEESSLRYESSSKEGDEGASWSYTSSTHAIRSAIMTCFVHVKRIDTTGVCTSLNASAVGRMAQALTALISNNLLKTEMSPSCLQTVRIFHRHELNDEEARDLKTETERWLSLQLGISALPVIVLPARLSDGIDLSAAVSAVNFANLRTELWVQGQI